MAREKVEENMIMLGSSDYLLRIGEYNQRIARRGEIA